MEAYPDLSFLEKLNDKERQELRENCKHDMVHFGSKWCERFGPDMRGIEIDEMRPAKNNLLKGNYHEDYLRLSRKLF